MELLGAYNDEEATAQNVIANHPIHALHTEHVATSSSVSISREDGRPVYAYVSKRRRLNDDNYNARNSPTIAAAPLVPYSVSKHIVQLSKEKRDDEEEEESVDVTGLPSRLAMIKRQKRRCATYRTKAPIGVRAVWQAHASSISRLRWANCDGRLLASASLDGTVKIWDPFYPHDSLALPCTTPTPIPRKRKKRRGSAEKREKQKEIVKEAEEREADKAPKLVHTFTQHKEAVKSLLWGSDDSYIVSGGYDNCIIVSDVSTASTTHVFKTQEYVTALASHSSHPHVFVSGGYSNGMTAWDLRTQSAVQHYKGHMGQIQGLEFLNDGTQFLASSDITRRNATDRVLMVWDFTAGAMMSHSIYQETFTCPWVRVHPNGTHFVAQSTANYIALFSAYSPFKLVRNKRYGAHQVGGYPIGCDISADGSLVSSGSADGYLYIYNWETAKVVQRLQVGGSSPVLEGLFHPLERRFIAAAMWDGSLALLA